MADPAQLAAAFDRLLTPGNDSEPGPDPLALMAGLMTGTARFHSVFLAPFTPSFASARARYLTDGSGPLGVIAEELARQGAPDPSAAARAMLAAAQGMCVVVLALDQGVTTVPQLFFGQLPADMRTHLVAAIGSQIEGRAVLTSALAELAEAIANRPWPGLIAGPAWHGDQAGYWLELAAALLEGRETLPGLGGATAERVADLATWISHGIVSARAGGMVDADDLELLIRVQLLAGAPDAAGQGIDALIRAGEVDDEHVIELLNCFTEGAIAAGQASGAATWLVARVSDWQTHLGGCYDVPWALLRLQAAAGFGAEALLPTARGMFALNRKAARNDLTKEPIWQVHDAVAEVLTTAEAAEMLDRSASFVVKRLAAKTIPWCQLGDQIRLPKQALSGWQAIMVEFALLT